MPISFGDEHTGGSRGAAGGDWSLGPSDQQLRGPTSFVTASMQAPSSSPADSESVLPTMQALPPQPGAMPCPAHNLTVWIQGENCFAVFGM